MEGEPGRDRRVRGRPYNRRLQSGRANPDVARDFDWAWNNLDLAKPNGAPSGFARVLHEQARENKWEFVKMVLARGLGKVGVGRAVVGSDNGSGEDLGDALIDRLLEGYARGKSDGIVSGGSGGEPVVP